MRQEYQARKSKKRALSKTAEYCLRHRTGQLDGARHTAQQKTRRLLQASPRQKDLQVTLLPSRTRRQTVSRRSDQTHILNSHCREILPRQAPGVKLPPFVKSHVFAGHPSSKDLRLRWTRPPRSGQYYRAHKESPGSQSRRQRRRTPRTSAAWPFLCC